jgi:uncharacterized protein YqjF (DUF2071 family)/predicted DCC family thiol-disulfide oxidoreductase YuxK
MRLPFLSATWSNLIFVNYEIDPSCLEPYLPRGVEVDTYQGKALISIVAFYFDKNKFLGKIPTVPASAFEEINLRFYVIRRENDTIKRGVVFVKEVVPSRLIAWTARTVYNEPYERWRTSRSDAGFEPSKGGSLSYQFAARREKYEVSATTAGPLKELAPESAEEFIVEHYWGYTKQPYGFSEYQVAHPRWRYWNVCDFSVSKNFGSFYGEPFSTALNQTPHSVFIATGSDVTVQWGRKLFIPPRGWVLYDGRCGFCTCLISALKPSLARAGFESAPLQAPWVAEQTSIPQDALSDDIRLLLADGQMISGAAAYRYVMKQIWWCAPIGYLCDAPGARWLMERLYAIINRNRFRISKSCGLLPSVDAEGEK